MGLSASSLALTQYDVEEVVEHCGGRFTSREIQSLYKRFRSLDKRHKGYLSEEELMSIPELAISPLASRVVQVFQNLNFKDFCAMLSSFSDRASRDEKLDFMFKVYDVDRDGCVTASDLETIVKHLVGSSLNEEQVAELMERAMGELAELRRKNKGKGGSAEGGQGGITFHEFRTILEGASKLPIVKVPVGFD
jgi:serine/threonine-protein phosphatase 2B regulatory subunit